MLTKQSLATDLRALGMTSGDTIFVHSARSRYLVANYK